MIDPLRHWIDTGESFHQNDLIFSGCSSSKIILAVLNQVFFFFFVPSWWGWCVCEWQGGPSTLDNCQILQVTLISFSRWISMISQWFVDFSDEVSSVQAPANRAKGARVNVSKSELQQKSAYCTLSSQVTELSLLARSFFSCSSAFKITIKIRLLWLCIVTTDDETKQFTTWKRKPKVPGFLAEKSSIPDSHACFLRM